MKTAIIIVLILFIYFLFKRSHNIKVFRTSLAGGKIGMRCTYFTGQERKYGTILYFDKKTQLSSIRNENGYDDEALLSNIYPCLF